MTKPAVAYLGLGSNMGDREQHLRDALRALEGIPDTHVLRTSSIYGSAPWGPVEQPDYLNMVAEVTTTIEAEELLGRLKEIEKALGREDGVRWGPRPIDIDIVLYGDRHMVTERLQVPHPRMWERAFVLKPLSELRPDLHDPSGKPIIEALRDKSIANQGVWAYSPQQR